MPAYAIRIAPWLVAVDGATHIDVYDMEPYVTIACDAGIACFGERMGTRALSHPPQRRARAWLLMIVLASACGGEDEGPNARGAGLRSAALQPGQRGDAYAAALRGVFDVGPGLVLLLDPRVLPRSRTGESKELVTPEVLQTLRTSGAIQGTCQADTTAANAAPICLAETAGYIIRVSDVFAMNGDTVQLYVTAERYRPSRDTTGFQPPLRLEQRYILARRGGRWTVANKERLVD